MQKLLFVLLAFLAAVTFIRTFDTAEAGEMPQISAIETLSENSVEIEQ